MGKEERNVEYTKPIKSKTTIFARLLLVVLMVGLVLVSLSAFASAQVSVQATGINTDVDVGSGGPDLSETTSDVRKTVDQTKDTATGLVHDTTGIDASGATDSATGLVPGDTDGATGSAQGTTSSSNSEPRPLTTEEVTTAGVLTAASGAGILVWLQSVLGIGFGRLFMAPMFSRIHKDELLDNSGRDELCTLVDENPGIGLKDLCERTGLGWGTTVYHMSRLEDAGFVASIKNGQNRHFFKNGHPAALMKEHVAVLRNETAGNLARFLLATPGSTQTTIAKRLGLGAPTVTKYVKRMERQGLVQVVQDGRSKIVQPTGVLQNALDHAAPMPTAPQQTPMAREQAIGVA